MSFMTLSNVMDIRVCLITRPQIHTTRIPNLNSIMTFILHSFSDEYLKSIHSCLAKLDLYFTHCCLRLSIGLKAVRLSDAIRHFDRSVFTEQTAESEILNKFNCNGKGGNWILVASRQFWHKK